jgi:hypothetical protein
MAILSGWQALLLVASMTYIFLYFADGWGK